MIDGLLHFAPGCGFQRVLAGVQEVKSNTISTKDRTNCKIGKVKRIQVCRFVEAIRLFKTIATAMVGKANMARPKGTAIVYSLST